MHPEYSVSDPGELSLVTDFIESEDDSELEEQEPIKPTIDTRQKELETREVLYDTTRREPGDVVLSGPVIGGWGPGRYFQNRRRAERWLQDKYGAGRVRQLEGATRGRWAFLVKGLKNEA